MYKYPFRKPSCTGERYWHFLGNDGNLYCNLNGPIDFAILNIGYEHPELISVTWVLLDKNGNIAKKCSTYNLDRFFSDMHIERPKS